MNANTSTRELLSHSFKKRANKKCFKQLFLHIFFLPLILYYIIILFSIFIAFTQKLYIAIRKKAAIFKVRGCTRLYTKKNRILHSCFKFPCHFIPVHVYTTHTYKRTAQIIVVVVATGHTTLA